MCILINKVVAKKKHALSTSLLKMGSNYNNREGISNL